MNSTTPSPLSFWRVFLAGSSLLLLFEATGVFLGAKIGSLGVFFVLLFGGFFVGGFASKYIGKWAGIAGVIGFFMAVILSVAAQPLALVLSGQKTKPDRPISVADVPNHNAAVFEFTDGTVLTAYAGYYSYRGSTMAPRTGGRSEPYKVEVFVAPLVDDNWTKTDPVPVWIVCRDNWNPSTDVSDTDTCRRKWNGFIPMGTTMDARHNPDIKTAVDNATAEYGLHSHPQAKYITWSGDPDVTNNAVRFSLTLLVIAHVSYAIAVIVKRKSL